MKVAIVNKFPSNINYQKYFKFPTSVQFSVHSLSPVRVKKLLKRDVTLELNPDEFDFVILVGSESMKHFTKHTTITTYSGHLVEDKFIPIIDPSMLVFKPEATKLWEDSLEKLLAYINGERLVTDIGEYEGIQDANRALEVLQDIHNSDYMNIALDCETSALYPRNGYILGISISYKENQGYYIDSDVLDEQCVEKLQNIIDSKRIIMHNGKFDIGWIERHLGVSFHDEIEDTMLMHYTLDEQPGTHGLKQLAIKYTDLGAYDDELDTYKKEFCRQHGLKQADFSYDLIPFEIMQTYAAKDTAATLALYNKFRPLVQNSENLNGVYENILSPASHFLRKLEDNGVPFDVPRLEKANTYLLEKLGDLRDTLYQYEEIAAFEKDQGKAFNANSPIQLRKLMFDYLGLTPTGKLTGTGADSTDVEVLTMLSADHRIPAVILELRQTTKLLSTYVTKILAGLDYDARLRTNFNLIFTTSGRLSSSGKLNMQQIPRDNPLIKGCIRARPGYKIVAMDLATAEMYYAAVLSGDKALMQVFKDKDGDFHSSVAKMVFNLTCSAAEVKKFYPTYRQAAKAISFGILFGAGAPKVAHEVNEFALKESVENDTEYVPFRITDATGSIDKYFETYPQLDKWLTKNKNFIRSHGYIYSAFGRKRRLPNVFSENNHVASGEVRSGINFLIQSVASDVNLLGAEEAFRYVDNDKAKMFALVHDSILAEVKDEYVDEYCDILAKCIVKDRGVSIPGSPIGLDFDIGQDYSFGKFEERYAELC